MTLREMLRDYPHLFRQDQTWHAGEAFMDTPASPRVRKVCVREGGPPACRAVDLAQAYLFSPDAFKWRRWLWTVDVDRYGQRVFVGVQDGRFEIHRHLSLTPRWGTPQWLT